MLLLLTGSSCAGKTTAGLRCADLPGLAVHDSDENGVPSDADTAWRQRDLESWVRRAIDLGPGTDLLLTGQSPLGELLAVPSAPEVDGLAVCLLDVADDVRLDRLRARDGSRWSEAEERDFVGWGRWHRTHAAEPTAMPQVITSGGCDAMAWDRWSSWVAGDPRWQTYVVDTTGCSVDESASDVRRWVERARRERTNPVAG